MAKILPKSAKHPLLLRIAPDIVLTQFAHPNIMVQTESERASNASFHCEHTASNRILQMPATIYRAASSGKICKARVKAHASDEYHLAHDNWWGTPASTCDQPASPQLASDECLLRGSCDHRAAVPLI